MKRLFFLTLLLCAVVSQGFEVDWTKAKTVQTGISLLSLEYTEPRLIKAYIMRVDMSTPGLRFMGTPRDPDWGKPMPDWKEKKPEAKPIPIHTKREKTNVYLETARKPQQDGGLGRNVIAAFNTTPWSPWCAPWTWQYARLSGTNVTDGVVLSSAKGHEAIFVVHQNNRMEIVKSLDTQNEELLKDIVLACSGFAILCKDGALAETPGKYETALHPRLAVGFDKEQKFLYVVAVDGRKEGWSLGMAGQELAQLLLDAGVSDGVNMDGGGSATMCYWDAEAQKTVLVNKACGSAFYRPVSYNVGIYLKKD